MRRELWMGLLRIDIGLIGLMGKRYGRPSPTSADNTGLGRAHSRSRNRRRSRSMGTLLLLIGCLCIELADSCPPFVATLAEVTGLVIYFNVCQV